MTSVCVLVAAVAGSAPASCPLYVNRATSRCLLLGLDSDCGGVTSQDRWRTRDSSNLCSTHRYTDNIHVLFLLKLHMYDLLLLNEI